MLAIEVIYYCLVVYGVIGLAVALLFLVFGLDKVEEAARGAYLFRLQIIPGLVLLWPLVIYRWRSASRSISEDADAT